MSNQITIKGDEGEIILQILGRENVNASNLCDANWLRTTLSVRASSFSGTIEIGLWVPELVALRDRLEAILRNLTDGLQFESMESNWKFNVAFEITGAVIISGSVRKELTQDNMLHYEFRSDPISLELVARDIRRVTEAYPES